MVARWPGRIAAASESDALVFLGNLTATCAEIVGFDLPVGAAEDRFSFLHALEGDTANGAAREWLIHHSGEGMFAIR